MKKIFLLVMVIVFIVGSVMAQECPSLRPGCKTWKGDMDIVGGDLTISGSVGIGGDTASNTLINSTVPDNYYGHELLLTITDGTTATRRAIGPDITINNATAGNKNFQAIKAFQRIKNAHDNSGHISAFTASMYHTYNTDVNRDGTADKMSAYNQNFTITNSTSTDDTTIAEFNGYLSQGITSVTVAGGGSTTLDDLYSFHAADAGQTSAGFTWTRQTGLWIDDLTSASANYGIVLDSDGDGVNACSGCIFLGANQESLIYHHGGDNLRIEGAQVFINLENTATATFVGQKVYVDHSYDNGTNDTALDARITYSGGANGETLTMKAMEARVNMANTTVGGDTAGIQGLNINYSIDSANTENAVSLAGTSLLIDYDDNGSGTWTFTNALRSIWIQSAPTDFATAAQYGIQIQDINQGTANYGIVLDDGTDGIYLNGISSPTLLLNDDGTNGAITVNAGLDVVGIPTGTTANGALGGGESVVGAVCMSDSNEIYIDTDGSCAD